MTSCELPRHAPIADTPHTMIDADIRVQRADIVTLDLAGCNITYINMALNEYEKATGQRFEQWPDTIRMRMEIEVTRFVERNAGATVKAVTTGVNNNTCVLAIHWRPKQ